MNKTWTILTALAALLLVIQALAVAQSTTTTVSVDSARPMGDAAIEIERISGTPVNYEDVRCDFPGDQVDITKGNVTPAQEQLALQNGFGPVKLIAPRGGPLSVAVAVDPSTLRLPDANATASALNDIISIYNSSGTLSGRFQVDSYSGEFFLEPVEVRDVSGNAVAIQPVLSTPITLPLAKRNAYQTLDLILQTVSTASGFKIGIGGVPMNMLALGQVTIGADNEPASHVLARFMNSLLGYASVLPASSPALSYRVLYDVQLKYYMFNLHQAVPLAVRYAPPPATAPAPGVGRPGMLPKNP